MKSIFDHFFATPKHTVGFMIMLTAILVVSNSGCRRRLISEIFLISSELIPAIIVIAMLVFMVKYVLGAK